jgi:hypothetical protein
MISFWTREDFNPDERRRYNPEDKPGFISTRSPGRTCCAKTTLPCKFEISTRFSFLEGVKKN